ncbi:MAG: hypothetical protein K9H49_10220 [Bacteroidales bacterium]|nr:hypothetical protein [Bacteroidales bacterium]
MEDDWYSDVSNSCIKENIEIRVLKTGNSSLIDFESYGKQNEWNLLPKQLKHGFLLGVSINNSNEEIMYWVTTW